MKRKLYVILSVAIILLILLSGCTGASQQNSCIISATANPNHEWVVPEDILHKYSNEILYVRRMGKVTGKDAFSNTAERFDVGAADLGICYYDAELQRLVTIFGDTFGADMSGNWRSNVALYTDQSDYSVGIAYNGALTAVGPGEKGVAVQLTPNDGRGVLVQGTVSETPKTSTCIPTGAVMVGSTTYVFYMEVDENGFQDSGEWFVYHCRVLKSEDHGASWSQIEGLTWQARTEDGKTGSAPNFAQIYPLLAEDGYIYLYGIPGGRSGGAKLGRVAPEKIEDFSSYEYFIGYDISGDPKWSAGVSGLSYIKSLNSAYVLDKPCGEICVTYNEYLGKYLALYQSGDCLVYRTADNPWGPFSKPETILKTAADVYLGYGAFTCQQMSDYDGQRIWILVSEWWPIYNVEQIEIVFR